MPRAGHGQASKCAEVQRRRELQWVMAWLKVPADASIHSPSRLLMSGRAGQRHPRHGSHRLGTGAWRPPALRWAAGSRLPASSPAAAARMGRMTKGHTNRMRADIEATAGSRHPASSPASRCGGGVGGGWMFAAMSQTDMQGRARTRLGNVRLGSLTRRMPASVLSSGPSPQGSSAWQAAGRL